MSLAPCKDCQKRYLGCHDKCEAYQEFHKERMKIRQKRNEARDQYYGTLVLGKKRRRRNKNGYL